MRRFLFIIGVLFTLSILVACHTTENAFNPNIGASVTPVSVYTFKPDTFSKTQIDSVIVIDRLPLLKEWKSSSFKDGETNMNSEYKTVYNNRMKMIYTVKILKNKYVLFKKKLYEE